MERRRLRETPVRLLAADLDGTLLGDRAALRRFARAWAALPARARPLLVYNSGRRAGDVAALVAAGELPAADHILGAVGTEVGDPALDRAWRRRLRPGWNLARAEAVAGRLRGAARQPARLSNPFKSSWYLRGAGPRRIAALHARLRAARVAATVVYSSGRDLDILPARAGKGGALAWLCRRLGVPLRAVVVAGDTGNDRAMFLLPGVRAIAVGNAQPDLLEASSSAFVYRAGRPAAAGVVEGLRFYGVLAGRR